MTSIPARDLRNDVSAVLRRVEAGERLTVTVSGRPVAELIPLDPRPESFTWEEFERIPKADAALYDELRELFPEMTDDDDIPQW